MGLELTHAEGHLVLVGDGGVELLVGGESGSIGLLEGYFFGGFFREFTVGEVFGAEEEIEFFAEFAGELGFELGVGETLLALGEGGGIGFGSVADADDVEDGVTFCDFIAEHVFDFAVVGWEVGLLDRVAVDGEKGVLGEFADLTEVAGGGGNEDVGAFGGHWVGE